MSISVWKVEYTKNIPATYKVADWFDRYVNDQHVFYLQDEEQRKELLEAAVEVEDKELREDLKKVLNAMELESDYMFF